MDLKRINDLVSVTGQIYPEDVVAIKSAGFVTLVNNRPDAESPGQPSGENVKIAAKAAGLSYYNIPMGREGVSPEMIENTRAVLEGSDGPVLCFCRTGTRSTTLWALSQAGRMAADQIIDAAANAGYDMTHLAGHLGSKTT